jgi:hypothetical protein
MFKLMAGRPRGIKNNSGGSAAAGTFGIAALRLNRKFIGMEKDLQSFTIARSQLANLNWGTI